MGCWNIFSICDEKYSNIKGIRRHLLESILMLATNSSDSGAFWWGIIVVGGRFSPLCRTVVSFFLVSVFVLRVLVLFWKAHATRFRALAPPIMCHLSFCPDYWLSSTVAHHPPCASPVSRATVSLTAGLFQDHGEAACWPMLFATSVHLQFQYYFSLESWS